MNGVRVMCPDCGETVVHRCGVKLRKELIDFYQWAPEHVHEKVYKAIVSAGRSEGWIEKGEEPEGMPFFGTQAWSYAIFGKDSARAFHAFIDSIAVAAGFDPHELRNLAYNKVADAKFEKANREKNKSDLDEAVKFLKSEAPLDERKERLAQILRKRSRSIDIMKDEGLQSLHRYIRNTLSGGINDAVNVHVVQALQEEAKSLGNVLVEFFGPTGRRISHRGFLTYEDAEAFVIESGTYDPESEDLSRRAGFARVTGSNREQDSRFQRSKKGVWTPYVESPRAE